MTSPSPSEPVPFAAALGAALLYALVAVLAAVIEVLLVPVRIGTTVVPVTVALAALTMAALPALAGIATGRTLGAAVPAAAWVISVVMLSQARPEGDVLLVGSAPLVYVTYAMLGLGAVSGIAGVMTFDRRRIHAGTTPGQSQPGQSQPGQSQPGETQPGETPPGAGKTKAAIPVAPRRQRR